MGARVRGLLVMMTLPLLQRQLEVLMERHRPNARACGVVAGAGAVWGRWNAATTAVLNAMWARAVRQAVAPSRSRATTPRGERRVLHRHRLSSARLRIGV